MERKKVALPSHCCFGVVQEKFLETSPGNDFRFYYGGKMQCMFLQVRFMMPL